METGNKFVLFIVLSLSSILLYAEGAACAPKGFRYLEPSIALSKETHEAPAPSTKSTPRPTLIKPPTSAPPSPPTPKPTKTPTATDSPDGPEPKATKTPKATPTAMDSPDGPEPKPTKKPKKTPTVTDSPNGPEPKATKTPKATPTAMDSPDAEPTATKTPKATLKATAMDSPDGPELTAMDSPDAEPTTKTPKATPKATATDSPDGPEPEAQTESSSKELKPGYFTLPTLPIQTTQTAPNPQVKKACDSTDNPLLCIQSIGPFMQDKFDNVNILESEMKAVQAHTQQLIEKATKIAQDPSTAPDVAEGINLCKENYDSVISNLDEAIGAMATHDIGKMNSMLSAVFSEVSTCQDTFSEVTTSPSPLTGMETPIKDLASNCLALLSTVNWN